jgi:serine/threonine-protein kinase PBS1
MAMQGPPASELKQAVGVAAMCLQENHALRPVMTDVVISLSFLAASTTHNHHHHHPPPLRPSPDPSYAS